MEILAITRKFAPWLRRQVSVRHAAVWRIPAIPRVGTNVIGAHNRGAMESRFKNGRGARQPKALERHARGA